MNANEIRAALLGEAATLGRSGHDNAAKHLGDFAKAARSEELIRFRELMLATAEPDVDALIAEGERSIDEAFYSDK